MKKHRMPYFDIVDRNGHPQGYTASIEEAYRRGLWHRSVQVVVFTLKGEILVQQRAAGSIILPNFLDMSAAGGVDPGETPLQAASRETYEEVGIRAPLDHYVPLPVRRYDHRFPRFHIHSRALIHPFLLPLHDSNVRIRLEESEVAAARFVSLPEAKRLVGHHTIKWGRLVPRFAFYRYLISEVERRLG